MSGGGGAKTRMVMSDINVTPLVDVMLVLLIMFMVTAPLMQQGLEVDVPKVASSGVDISEDPFRIVVTADRRITIAKQALSISNLTEKLKSIFDVRKNKQVYLEADAKVDYGFVAEVMADIRAAGITNIGLITQPHSP